MHWFATIWFWVLIGAAFIAMHLFGLGGHAGHGGGDRPRRDDEGETDDPPGRRVNQSADGHQH